MYTVPPDRRKVDDSLSLFLSRIPFQIPPRLLCKDPTSKRLLESAPRKSANPVRKRKREREDHTAV